MDINQQLSEIEQFLIDIRQHLTGSLETSEYENTSNLFHVTEAERSLQLLQKCDQLLEKFADKNHNVVNRSINCDHHQQQQQQQTQSASYTKTTGSDAKIGLLPDSNGNVEEPGNRADKSEDGSYLDMTLSKKISASKEYIALNNNNNNNSVEFVKIGADGDPHLSSVDNHQKAVAATSNAAEDVESDLRFDEDPQIYDICQVVTPADLDDTNKPITCEINRAPPIDCPYLDLPAGHLAIQRSTKYGQLQRIEKRLFFDQSKKCYCGILNDWLLCYSDGPTTPKPSITLHLKSPGVEIEHSGDGKRREVCFQITTGDPNKKFLFQANNEVDAKEWIHAIEAAIRGDGAAVLKNARKLPTPPVLKRLTFISSNAKTELLNSSNQIDCIYEEPSPLYHVHEPTELLISKGVKDQSPPPLPNKLNDANALAKKYEYDVPKCPPQPLKAAEAHAEPEAVGLLNNGETPTSESAHFPNESNNNNNNNNNNKDDTLPLHPASQSATDKMDKIDFQAKIKDVHSKLSSQFAAGMNLQKKSVRKSLSSSSNEILEPTPLIIVTTPSPPSTKELKKQRKSSTPSPSSSTSTKTASIGKPSGNHSFIQTNNEKSAKNWFLNRLNKTTSSTRNSSCSIPSPAKCKQSEKENLLSNLEIGDSYEGTDSNPASPILKSSVNSAVGAAKSKVNMIINQFESSGHLAMFNVEALAGNAVATFNSFCDSDCSNYEPIMTLSTPPSSFLKKV